MKDHQDLIALARKRMSDAQDAERPHIERGQSDLLFATGEGQWREEDLQEREAQGKPSLTFNAMPQYVRQVTGQIRSLNPAIKVSPADGAASKDVAEIVEGLVRDIEYRCDAPSIYEAAAESAAQCSIGWWRVRTDYCDEYSFDQEILIERVYNPFSVFCDPMAKHPTRKDMGWCFVIEEMPREEFREAYPSADTNGLTSDHKIPYLEYWSTADTVTIAEYYWIEYDEEVIAQTPMGQIIKGPLPKGVDFARKRTVKKPRVMWAKITGAEVLEGPTQVPGRHIPVVAVTGEEIHLGETTYRSSVIRFAKDAQMLYNVARSSDAEVVMLQPRAPFMVTTHQIAGLEEFWNDANNSNRPYLPYNPDDKAGMPQRIQPPVSSTGLMNQAQMAVEDMKRTTGIYDASLGARSNETSGKAIQERKMESQNSTSVYQDNMIKGVAHTGRIILDMIPQVYDAQRIVRILGEDGQEKLVAINQMMQSVDGIVPINDMTIGKYEARVSVGPAYSTKREAAAEGMAQFMQALPGVAPMIADLVAKSQEWPESERIAERLRKTLPPGIAEDQEDEMTPEQMQAKQQAMMQQQQQMQAQQQAQEIEMRKAQAEADEAEADAMKAQAEAQKAQMELAAINGQLNQLVRQQVQQAVAALVQPMMRQPI